MGLGGGDYVLSVEVSHLADLELAISNVGRSESSNVA